MSIHDGGRLTIITFGLLLARAALPAASARLVRQHREWWVPLDPANHSLAALPSCCASPLLYRECAHGAQRRELARYVGARGVPRNDGPARMRAQLARRRVLLLGDSTTTQWYESLVCYAGWRFSGYFGSLDDALRAPGEPTEAYAAWGAAIMRALGRLPLHRRASALGLHFTRTSPRRPPPDDPYPYPYPYPYLGYVHVRGAYLMRIVEAVRAFAGISRAQRVDLLVIDPASKHLLRRPLALAVAAAGSACEAERVRCALREPTPQHFQYASLPAEANWGGFVKRRADGVCAALPDPYDAAAAGRKRDLMLAHARNTTVLRAFDALVPMPLHPGARRGRVSSWEDRVDCTHYTGDTEVWEPLHLALLDHLETIA